VRVLEHRFFHCGLGIPALKWSLYTLSCCIVVAVSACESGDKSHAVQTLRAVRWLSKQLRHLACPTSALAYQEADGFSF
jgi:hypothetical protein